MYNLIANILQIPETYANSTITYVAGCILLLFTVVMIDMVYRIFRSIVKSVERR